MTKPYPYAEDKLRWVVEPESGVFFHGFCVTLYMGNVELNQGSCEYVFSKDRAIKKLKKRLLAEYHSAKFHSTYAHQEC